MVKAKRVGLIFFYFGLIVLLVYSILAFFNVFRFNSEVIVWVTIILVIGAILLNDRYCKYGINAMALYYMMMSQFGYIISYSIFGSLANTRMAYSNNIRLDDTFNTAVLISVIAVIVYVLVSFVNRRYKFIFGTAAVCIKERGINEQFIFYSQMFVLLIQLIISVATYYMFGNIPYSTRSELIAKNFAFMLYWSYFSECSIPLIVATCSKKHIIQSFILYIPIVALQFLLGNRGEIMYGALVIIAVFALKNAKSIDTKKILIFGFACVIFLPTIASFREGGVFAFTSLKEQFASFFSELGFQIVPTKFTVDYISSTGDFQHGATYFYDFLLRISNILGLNSATMANSMARIDNMLPNYGYGLGFSQVAESYYNFGLFGIIIEMAVLAKLSIFFENKVIESNKKDSLIIDICLAVNLINITRNKFDSTFIFLIYALLIYFLHKFFASNISETETE